MKKQHNHGFTLIELLVVIGIIAVLSAILFPVFAKARERARMAVCSSNEKQIGMALMQYSEDYDEHWVAEERYFSGNRYQWPAILVNYTKSRDIFTCPSDPNSGIAYENGQGTFKTAYGANLNGYNCYNATPWDSNVTFNGNGMFGGAGSPGVSEAEVSTPSTTIAVAEMWGGSGSDMLELDDYCADWSKWRFAVPHTDRRSNYLFADGHIKALRPFDTIANGVNMWTRDNTAAVWQGLRDHLQTGYDTATQK